MEPKASAAQIQMYLKELDYPVLKNHIINHAEIRSAPDNVINTLNRLPERWYNGPTDIEREYGKLK